MYVISPFPLLKKSFNIGHYRICLILVFTGCGDGIARAYDAKSATLKRFYQGHEGAINCLTVVDDKLYTGSSDGTMRVWDAKDIRYTFSLSKNCLFSQ